MILWDIGYLLDQEESRSRPVTQQGAHPHHATTDAAAGDAPREGAAEGGLESGPHVGEMPAPDAEQPRRPSSHGSGRQQASAASCAIIF